MADRDQTNEHSKDFIFNFLDEKGFESLAKESHEKAEGYLIAIGDFCRVIHERAQSNLNFQELKTELLSLVKERGEFDSTAYKYL